MLKRLIEVALPLKEVSEQSAREKSIRHGHISTLHIWWARRPLAACRAVVFASLIPDPDDPECPEHFRTLVMDLLKHERFRPTTSGAHPSTLNPQLSTIPDTPRNRCLEFIKHLVRWENSNNPEFIEPARKLIAAAHKFLHGGTGVSPVSDAPKVLDPFAGGGAIPLEALRLGCEAHAIDLNPVAHLIELCTLVYPQKYGQPDSRPVPDYIQRHIERRKAEGGRRRRERSLFAQGSDSSALNPPPSDLDDIIPDVEITEAEYRKNPLAADMKYWGHWVLEKARREIGQFYPPDPDGSVPVAYLWARTVKCANPQCAGTVPLIQQQWVCNRPGRKTAIRFVPNFQKMRCRFEIVRGETLDFDPSEGTMQHGRAQCPFCSTVITGEQLRSESKKNRMSCQLMAVASAHASSAGKRYRTAVTNDEAASESAAAALEAAKKSSGPAIVANERMTPDRPSPNSRGLSGVVRYGLDNFGKLFNERQSLAMTTFVACVQGAADRMPSTMEAEYKKSVCTFLAVALDRLPNQSSNLCRLDVTRETLQGTYSRQALAMVWDYAEVNPIGDTTGGWCGALEWVYRVIVDLSGSSAKPGVCHHSSSTAIPFERSSLHAVVTNPPYYDSVPYSDLSDFSTSGSSVHLVRFTPTN